MCSLSCFFVLGAWCGVEWGGLGICADSEMQMKSEAETAYTFSIVGKLRY